MGHTKGPWHIEKERRPCETGWRMVSVNGETIFDCTAIDYEGGGTPPIEPDANLICAAPDLLAALKEIAKGEGRYSRDPLTHADNTIDNMKAIAVSAIAKAEGK